MVHPLLLLALVQAPTDLPSGAPTPSPSGTRPQAETPAAPAPAAPAQDARLVRLEAELAALRQELSTARAEDTARHDEQVAALTAEIEQLRSGAGSAAAADRLRLGGYGEIHYNDRDGAGGSQIDLHRFVVYLGYRLSDDIQLHSETELEHAYVEDGNGELAIEQLFLDFRVAPATHVEVGRMLAPLGIVNQRHEPPTFNGVERPSVETVVLPTTWSMDGVGLAGELSPAVRYRLMITSSLDGSEFSALNGIRGGRQKERPSMNEPAFSGRIDFFPQAGGEGSDGDSFLRLGVSGFYGGLDNGNQGNDPGVNGDLWIASADAEFSLGRLDLRGVAAWEGISGASDLSGATGESISSAITGWYLEAAWHCLPDSWSGDGRGLHDAVVFARYDDIDTQRNVPSGFTRDPAGDRSEWTLGVGLYPLANLALKADYQIRDDEASKRPASQLNLGVGWSL